MGVHAGWNLRHPDMGAPDDELFLVGSTWWLDDLPSLENHVARSRAVIEELIRQRFVLEEDVPRLVARAEEAWHAASANRR